MCKVILVGEEVDQFLRNWESFPKVEKVWESARKDEKIWKSMVKTEKVWKEVQSPFSDEVIKEF